jgi:hypothetical protein
MPWTHMGEWSYSSIILDLGNTWWVVSFMLRRIYPPGDRTPSTHWTGGCMGLRASLDATEKRWNSALLGIEPWPSSPSLYRLTYPGSHYIYVLRVQKILQIIGSVFVCYLSNYKALSNPRRKKCSSIDNLIKNWRYVHVPKAVNNWHGFLYLTCYSVTDYDTLGNTLWNSKMYQNRRLSTTDKEVGDSVLVTYYSVAQRRCDKSSHDPGTP